MSKKDTSKNVPDTLVVRIATSDEGAYLPSGSRTVYIPLTEEQIRKIDLKPSFIAARGRKAYEEIWEVWLKDSGERSEPTEKIVKEGEPDEKSLQNFTHRMPGMINGVAESVRSFFEDKTSEDIYEAMEIAVEIGHPLDDVRMALFELRGSGFVRWGLVPLCPTTMKKIPDEVYDELRDVPPDCSECSVCGETHLSGIRDVYVYFKTEDQIGHYGTIDEEAEQKAFEEEEAAKKVVAAMDALFCLMELCEKGFQRFHTVKSLSVVTGHSEEAVQKAADNLSKKGKLEKRYALTCQSVNYVKVLDSRFYSTKEDVPAHVKCEWCGRIHAVEGDEDTLVVYRPVRPGLEKAIDAIKEFMEQDWRNYQSVDSIRSHIEKDIDRETISKALDVLVEEGYLKQSFTLRCLCGGLIAYPIWNHKDDIDRMFFDRECFRCEMDRVPIQVFKPKT